MEHPTANPEVRLHTVIFEEAKMSGFDDQTAELIVYETIKRWLELVAEKAPDGKTAAKDYLREEALNDLLEQALVEARTPYSH